MNEFMGYDLIKYVKEEANFLLKVEVRKLIILFDSIICFSIRSKKAIVLLMEKSYYYHNKIDMSFLNLEETKEVATFYIYCVMKVLDNVVRDKTLFIHNPSEIELETLQKKLYDLCFYSFK